MECPKCGNDYPNGCCASCDYKYPAPEWVSIENEMKWHSFKERPPTRQDIPEDTQFLILVNGMIEICKTMENGALYINIDVFLWNYEGGFRSDRRLATPTHWALAPPLPE